MKTFIEGTIQVRDPLDNLFDDEIPGKMDMTGDQNTALNTNSLLAINIQEDKNIQMDDRMTGDIVAVLTVENIIIGKLTVDTITESGVIIVINLVIKHEHITKKLGRRSRR